MIDYQENGADYCILGLSPGDFGLYILGDSFLRSYLSIYDFSNSRVGLAVHSSSNALVTKHKAAKRWMLPLVITVVSLFILIIGILIYKRYKRKQLEENLAYYNRRASEVDRKLYGPKGDTTEWLVAG